MGKRNLFNTESKKDVVKLSENFFYLLLTNGTNFIIPIIIIPFLVKRLGIDKFGLVMMAQALMSFLMIVTDYSFNLTGTQSASINRNNTLELQNIFNRIFTTKLVLLGISFLLLIGIVFLINKFWQERTLFLLSFAMVIGKTLFPVWFLQGIEKMKYIAYANVVAKILLIIFIISFINSASKYTYVNLFYSLGDLAAGVLSLLLIKKISNIHIRLVGFSYVQQQLKSGGYIFVTAIANNTYVNSNILILGALTNSRIAGMYSVAEKAMLIVKQTAGIFLQATFPHACKLAVESVSKFKSFLKKEFYFFLILFSIAGSGMFLFAKNICIFFSKTEIDQTITYIRWFSIVPLIVALNIPAYQSLIINDHKKSLAIVIIFGALISVSLNVLLIPYFSAAGSVISIISTEIFVTLGLHSALKFRYKEYRIFK